MRALRIDDREDFFEMEPVIQCQDDVCLLTKVRSRGFTGYSETWVEADALSEFCRSLVELNETLRGEATLSSISPGELQVKFFAYNSRGGLAIEGSTGYYMFGENHWFWHAVSFGFEFESMQLSQVTKLPWVRKYANRSGQTPLTGP